MKNQAVKSNNKVDVSEVYAEASKILTKLNRRELELFQKIISTHLQWEQSLTSPINTLDTDNLIKKLMDSKVNEKSPYIKNSYPPIVTTPIFLSDPPNPLDITCEDAKFYPEKKPFTVDVTNEP